MTNDGSNTLTYDAEGRAILSSGSGGSGSYFYDGHGVRGKKTASVTTVYIFSGGKDIAEYDSGAAPSAPSREFIYAGGRLIMNVAGGTANYFHQDRLSNRMLTNASGGITAQRGHFPFGEVWYETGTTKWKFTTYERDTESANDYAIARYHVNRLGRFSSSDPLAGWIGDPQSLNRYTYTQNDPINSTDPLGQRRNLPCSDPDMHCAGGGGGDGLGLFYLGFGGGGPQCTADGVDMPCGMGAGLLRSGAGSQCPNNDCGVGTATPYRCIGDVCGYMSNEYAATHANSWDGALYSDDEWKEFKNDLADSQRQALTDAISNASNSPDGSNWDYIYQNLDPYKPGTDDLNITGGNVDFRWTGAGGYLNFVSADAWTSNGCTLCRYGGMDAIHFNNGLFHLDTASPVWGLGRGLIMHVLVDLMLGNINPSVPIGR